MLVLYFVSKVVMKIYVWMAPTVVERLLKKKHRLIKEKYPSNFSECLVVFHAFFGNIALFKLCMVGFRLCCSSTICINFKLLFRQNLEFRV